MGDSSPLGGYQSDYSLYIWDYHAAQKVATKLSWHCLTGLSTLEQHQWKPECDRSARLYPECSTSITNIPMRLLMPDADPEIIDRLDKGLGALLGLPNYPSSFGAGCLVQLSWCRESVGLVRITSRSTRYHDTPPRPNHFGPQVAAVLL